MYKGSCLCGGQRQRADRLVQVFIAMYEVSPAILLKATIYYVDQEFGQKAMETAFPLGPLCANPTPLSSKRALIPAERGLILLKIKYALFMVKNYEF